MTYFGFLGLFLIIPIAMLSGAAVLDHRRGKSLPSSLRNWPAWAAVGLHVIVALVYTTPWDNYLVATRVWWYDPTLVTGIVIGWVPIEEYTFFVLQPILAGLWLLALARTRVGRIHSKPAPHGFRWTSAALVMLIWGAAAIGLVADWQPGRYLSLELAWALPPIAVQLAFGADILWKRSRLVLLTLLPLTLYLSGADYLAIGSGTWTINPEQSLEMLLLGVLPLEELLFFLLTNTLITFGVILILSEESKIRLEKLRPNR